LILGIRQLIQYVEYVSVLLNRYKSINISLFLADGTTTATFKVGGEGTLDSSRANQGGFASKSLGKSAVGGHGIFRGWIDFDPYIEEVVELGTTCGASSAITFNGYMEATGKASWGSSFVNFPATAPVDDSSTNLQVSKGESNMLPMAND
jgi:hypothetical protein